MEANEGFSLRVKRPNKQTSNNKKINMERRSKEMMKKEHEQDAGYEEQDAMIIADEETTRCDEDGGRADDAESTREIVMKELEQLRGTLEALRVKSKNDQTERADLKKSIVDSQLEIFEGVKQAMIDIREYIDNKFDALEAEKERVENDMETLKDGYDELIFRIPSGKQVSSQKADDECGDAMTEEAQARREQKSEEAGYTDGEDESDEGKDNDFRTPKREPLSRPMFRTRRMNAAPWTPQTPTPDKIREAMKQKQAYKGQKLKGLENYYLFKLQTRSYFKQRGLDHWLFVEPDEAVADEVRSEARAYDHFLTNVADDLVSYVAEADSTKEVFEMFERMYGPEQNQKQRMIIQQRLVETKLEDTSDEGVSTYLKGMRKLRTQANNLGSKMDANEYIGRLIQGLPTTAAHIKATLSEKKFASVEACEQSITTQFLLAGSDRGQAFNTWQQGKPRFGKPNGGGERNHGKPNDGKIQCFKCGKWGSHFARNCRGKPAQKNNHRNNQNDKNDKDGKNDKKDESNANDGTTELSFFTMDIPKDEEEGAQANAQDENVKWLLDSGANVHVCKEKWAFITYREQGSRMKTTGGEAIVAGTGTVKVKVGKKILTLKNVRHAPDSHINIMSLANFVQKTGGKAVMEGKTIKLEDSDGSEILEGAKGAGGLYYVSTQVIQD